jgi:transposase
LSTQQNFDTAVELLRLQRLREYLSQRREQLQERVGHYPNEVNTRQLAALIAEQTAVERQIAQLETV